jgi:hypothetical protein
MGKNVMTLAWACNKGKNLRIWVKDEVESLISKHIP